MPASLPLTPEQRIFREYVDQLLRSNSGAERSTPIVLSVFLEAKPKAR